MNDVSPLMAALARSLGVDAARLLDEEAALALWGGEKLYDSLDLLLVAESAEKRGFPPDS